MERYLFDTSALMTLHQTEEGSDEVSRLLRRSRVGSAQSIVPFMACMEFLYCIWRDRGRDVALQSYLELKGLPMRRVDQTEEMLVLAAELKAGYSLSLGDSWVAAAAIAEKAILVHKDPQFEALKDRISLKALPYKR